ncbi:MAG: hypothetical protein WC709_07490 [Thermoleophilia bacterium]
MPKIDPHEVEVLGAYESGALKSVATKEELVRFKAAARATAIKDRRVNIRLSSGDLRDIQVRALEEGVPYQTLIASVLHRYVTGRLADRPAAGAQERRKTVNRSARTGKFVKTSTATKSPTGVRAQTKGPGKKTELR